MGRIPSSLTEPVFRNPRGRGADTDGRGHPCCFQWGRPGGPLGRGDPLIGTPALLFPGGQLGAQDLRTE